MVELLKEMLDQSGKQYQLSNNGLVLQLSICNGLAIFTKRFKGLTDAYLYIFALCKTETTYIKA